MPYVPLGWLSEYVELGGRDAAGVAAALVSVGLEEESLGASGVQGPLVVGQVVSMHPEPQKNGKTINWCQVDVGPQHNIADGSAGGAPRGIVCGAHNFGVGDKVVVSLPGAVLPGPFPITARKTYGHVSDGMICSVRELGIGEDHNGILRLAERGLDPEPGADCVKLLDLGDEVVEINITPDRGYCFSIRGVAREFSHATGCAFRDPAAVPVPRPTAGGFPVQVHDDAPIHGVAGCDRYVARVIRGCHAAGPSPSWMARRLEASGMRPISLAVDVTNYVMLELGQPLHAYDLAKLEGPIMVRRARTGERLVTLDDVDRVLDPEDLLITDSRGGAEGGHIIGLAGVMGGADTEVTDQTTDLLIEGAHFDTVTISRTERRHKLDSEAARRFERGVDTDLQAQAVQRVIDLLIEFGGGQADPEVTDVDTRPERRPISFDPAFPAAVVGVDYTPEQVKGVLESIGCEVSDAGANLAGSAVAERSGRARQPGQGAWSVLPPTWRPDLTVPVDLVEEVARIEGYSHIPSVVATGGAGRGLTPAQRARRSLARALADFGLVEVLTYPFVGEERFDQLGFAADDPRRGAVRLANPLDQTAPLLRTEILQTLVDAAKRNLARGFTDFGLFEFGLVAAPVAGQRPAAPIPTTERRPTDQELTQLLGAVPPQPRHAAGLMVGSREASGVQGKGRPADWADAIEAARQLARTVHVRIEAQPARRAPFHPGRCAELVAVLEDGAAWPGTPASGTEKAEKKAKATDVIVGYAGELAPGVTDALGLPARAVAFEVNLDPLLGVAGRVTPARPISAQPVAKEDFAFTVEAGVPAGAVAQAVRDGIGELAEAAWVFDVYEGDQMEPGHKSVAVSVRLRAQDHTLKSAEIQAARKKAVKAARKHLGAELRS